MAVAAGKSIFRSTVASGETTMKMINSTSITSMKGVTLISLNSGMSAVSSSDEGNREAMAQACWRVSRSRLSISSTCAEAARSCALYWLMPRLNTL
ncbi:hypothetical protein D3C72_2055200 [compost metagenome]